VEAEEDEQPAAARSTRNKPASAADEDEESIEAYMARLLNRSRGGSAAAAEQPAPSRRRSAPTPSPAPPVQAEPTPVAPPPKPVRQKAPAPPRAKAEERSDLAAMRELANLQARAAIQRHATTRSWRAPAVAWLVALACVGLSAVAFSVIAKGGVLVLLSGLAGLAAAGYWGYQGVKLTGQLLAARRYGQAGSNPTTHPSATKPAQPEQQSG
jgi:hypothetical protein